MKAKFSKVLAFVLALVLLIVTIMIVCFVFMQRQGLVNRLFGRLSSSTVSSISIESVRRPRREAVLEEDDQNKLIKLLRKGHYEGPDDPEFASITGWPTTHYSIHIYTKDGRDILLTINEGFCICCPDEIKGIATSKSEYKGYPVSKDGRDVHQEVMDLLGDLFDKYFPG